MGSFQVPPPCKAAAGTLQCWPPTSAPPASACGRLLTCWEPRVDCRGAVGLSLSCLSGFLTEMKGLMMRKTVLLVCYRKLLRIGTGFFKTDFKKKKKIDLFERQSYRAGRRQISHPVVLSPNGQSCLGLGKSCPVGLPCACRGSERLGHLLLLRRCIKRELD